jgi:capsular exopolysaccharide synthesis family protein
MRNALHLVPPKESPAPVVPMNVIPAQTIATDDESEEAIARDLIGYLAPLKRYWWLLIVVPLLLALMAYALGSRRPPSYSATTTVLVNPVTGSNGNPADNITAASMLTKTYSGFANSPAVLQRVITSLKLPETETQLETLVSVTADPASQAIRIAAQYHSAQGAADLANGVADQFVAFISDLAKSGASQDNKALTDSITRARADRDNAAAQLATLRNSIGTPTPDENTQIANLESLLQQYQGTYNGLLDLQQRLNATQLTSQTGVSVAVRAVPPPHPAGSLRLLLTAAAFLLGFGGTVVAVVLVEQMHPRVRSRNDLRRVADLPLLVTAPRATTDGTIAVLDEPRSAMSEAIYALQTRLWIEAEGHANTTIAITSAGPNEGATVIAANLATAFAQAGQRVVLVDGNLRAPSQWEVFKKDPKHPGLAELIAVPSLTPRDVLTSGPVPNLHLLLAGPVSVIPSERLTSAKTEHILEILRGRADIIIIDAPPPVADSNALLFAVEADHTIVVARAGRTRDDALRATIASIRAVKAHILGLVLSDADRGSAAV